MADVEFAGFNAAHRFEMQRDAAFSYTCNRCKTCCRNKVIPLNPYEVLRLAQNQGLSMSEFIERRTAEGQGVALKFLPPGEGGTCVFLGEEGCTVHPDRPLACRLYPLGRWTAGPGIEAFARVELDPGSKGEFGDKGTIADFLAGQGTEPYFAAAELYLYLYSKMSDIFERIEAGELSADHLPDEDWLDVEGVVARHCAAQGLRVPANADETARLHVEIVSGWLDLAERIADASAKQ